MTHIVLFKINKGVDLDSLEKTIRKTYIELDSLLDFIKYYRIERNCVVRDSNADIMIQIEMGNQEELFEYLNHPVHTNMINEISPYVLDKASFDFV